MCNISWSYTKSILMLTYTTFTHKTINVQRIKPYKCLKEMKRQAGISACCPPA